MKAIFLRGTVPPAHEHPEKLLYDEIDGCEDQWTQLFYYLLQEADSSGELLYQRNGKKREFILGDSFTEKWVDLDSYNPSFEPDVIICRGGFPYYDNFVKRFPNAKKVYYGAGRRYWPTTDFTDYDLFLVDSHNQYGDIANRGKNVAMLIKPAATMFRPIDVEKEYDVCFMANASQRSIKRHDLFLHSLAGSKLKILSLGNTDPSLVKLAKDLDVDVTWGGWHLRKFLPKMISSCKIGVCCSNNVDSCPRVIPEYLACDLPVVVTENVNFWKEYYITDETGLVIPESEILSGIKSVLVADKNPLRYYRENISMKVAAKSLRDRILGL